MVWQNGSDGKLERLPLMKEPGAKVMLYELPNDGQLDYDGIKKRRLNVFTGVGAGASQERIGEVVNFFQNIQGAAGPDNRDKNILAIMTKVDNLKVKNALDVIRPKLPKKMQTAVVNLDADTPDLLSRIRRGKRAFGSWASNMSSINFKSKTSYNVIF